MTPKEKAEDLKEKFDGYICYAEIAVDEIIKAHIHNEGVRHLQWWAEVKQELEKL